MQFSQWLEYIETLSNKKIDLTLSRLSKVYKVFPQITGKKIIVAGTNGKGSTVKLISALLNKKNLSYGAYTSPHLYNFKERLIINNETLADKDWCEAFHFVEENRNGLALTFFEFTTLAALYLIAKQKVDYAILEIGVGGRFDAVNIIDADLSIITSIDLDHQDFLGNTKADIAWQKVGVWRQKQIAIYADTFMPQKVKQLALDLNLQLFTNFTLECNSQDWNFAVADYKFKNLTYCKLATINAASAILAIKLLKVVITIAEINSVLEEVSLNARCEQKLINNIRHIFDVAHNAHATKLLAVNISKLKAKKVIAVFSALQDKDVKAMLTPLKAFVSSWFIAELSAPRARKKQDLIADFKALNITDFTSYSNVKKAYKSALIKADSSTTVIVFGSFYTIAELSEII